MSVNAGDINWYHLHEDVSLVSTLGAASAYAYADPLITIDPAFPNASQYSVIISEGVGNTLGDEASATPSWRAAALLAAPVIALFCSAGGALLDRLLPHGNQRRNGPPPLGISP